MNTSTARGYARVIVGIDGSGPSQDALLRAVQFAEKFGARVEVFCVWSYPVAITPIPPVWHPDRHARQVVTSISNAVVGQNWPAWFSANICEGSAAHVLVDESKTADLLVVGSRGSGGFSGLLLGSVSSHCAEHSLCPVLVVHDRIRRVDSGAPEVGVGWRQRVG